MKSGCPLKGHQHQLSCKTTLDLTLELIRLIVHDPSKGQEHQLSC